MSSLLRIPRRHKNLLSLKLEETPHLSHNPRIKGLYSLALLQNLLWFGFQFPFPALAADEGSVKLCQVVTQVHFGYIEGWRIMFERCRDLVLALWDPYL